MIMSEIYVLINTYISTFQLEITSELPAHSISLINTVDINGKQFMHLHGNVSWRQCYPD